MANDPRLIQDLITSDPSNTDSLPLGRDLTTYKTTFLALANAVLSKLGYATDSVAGKIKSSTSIIVNPSTGEASVSGWVKNNFSALFNPSAANDSSQGYSRGSQILNRLTGNLFVCLDATIGQAAWRVVSSKGIATLTVSVEEGSIDLNSIPQGVVILDTELTANPLITSASLYSGLSKTIIFAKDFDLVNSVNFVMPTDRNISAFAGDSCLLVGDSNNNATIIDYQRKNGTALVGGGSGSNIQANFARTNSENITLLINQISYDDSGTYALNFTDPFIRIVTGAGISSYVYNLPDCEGQSFLEDFSFEIINISANAAASVVDNGGNPVVTVSAGQTAKIMLKSATDANGIWTYSLSPYQVDWESEVGITSIANKPALGSMSSQNANSVDAAGKLVFLGEASVNETNISLGNLNLTAVKEKEIIFSNASDPAVIANVTQISLQNGELKIIKFNPSVAGNIKLTYGLDFDNPIKADILPAINEYIIVVGNSSDLGDIVYYSSQSFYYKNNDSIYKAGTSESILSYGAVNNLSPNRPNNLKISNALYGEAPIINVEGDDPDVNIRIISKGRGGLLYKANVIEIFGATIIDPYILTKEETGQVIRNVDESDPCYINLPSDAKVGTFFDLANLSSASPLTVNAVGGFYITNTSGSSPLNGYIKTVSQNASFRLMLIADDTWQVMYSNNCLLTFV